MRRVLIGVLIVLVIGAAVVVWLFTSSPRGSDDAGTGAASTSPSSSATAGPLPDATPTSGSEVIAPTTAPAQTLPPIEPVAPLIAMPFPSSATEEGGLAAGYPSEVMAPAPGSDVLQSAITTEGETMQVTLVARTDASEDDVRAHYAAAWSALGLREVQTSDGSSTFAGAYESLTLAFSPNSATGTRYTLFGLFRGN